MNRNELFLHKGINLLVKIASRYCSFRNVLRATKSGRFSVRCQKIKKKKQKIKRENEKRREKIKTYNRSWIDRLRSFKAGCTWICTPVEPTSMPQEYIYYRTFHEIMNCRERYIKIKYCLYSRCFDVSFFTFFSPKIQSSR